MMSTWGKEGLGRLDYLGHLVVSLFLLALLGVAYLFDFGGLSELSAGYPSAERLPASLIAFGLLCSALWILISATRRRMAHARLPEWIFWLLFLASALLPFLSTLLDPQMPWFATFLRAYSLIALAFLSLLIICVLIVRDFAMTPFRAELHRDRRLNGVPVDRIDPGIKIHPDLRQHFRKDRRKV